MLAGRIDGWNTTRWTLWIACECASSTPIGRCNMRDCNPRTSEVFHLVAGQNDTLSDAGARHRDCQPARDHGVLGSTHRPASPSCHRYHPEQPLEQPW